MLRAARFENFSLTKAEELVCLDCHVKEDDEEEENDD